MLSKYSFSALVFIFALYSVNNVVGLPRTVEKQDEVAPVPTIAVVHLQKSTPVLYNPSVEIPDRVACQSDETAEEPICQNLCNPKGYKYGLCVNHFCSCI